MASVSFETVRKVFGKTTALKDIDLLIRGVAYSAR